ncbi:unnamed protein product [Amaranthus hypochondriacus]
MERAQDQWQWKVQYARYFTFPSYYQSITTTSSPSRLSPFKRNQFRPIWLPSSGISTVSIHPSSDVSSSVDSVLSVSLQGTIIEEHFISKLQFIWPQVTYLSGLPTRGSLVVIASYVDSSNENQKFALRFSQFSEVEYFINALQDLLSNKILYVPQALNVISPHSAVSSDSDFIPTYRPDTSSIMTPIYDSISPRNLNKEDQPDSQIQETIADSQSKVEALPPAFTSLVSSCAADLEQGSLDLTLAVGEQDADMKTQIAKYMQDSSFLDMVNKVNDVITELGGNYAI